MRLILSWNTGGSCTCDSRIGHIRVATDLSRVTYLSPILFYCKFYVGEKVGNMENIIWKRMIYHGKDLGNYYFVSNTGEIKGTKTGIIRKKNTNHEGYYFVCISLGSRNNKPLIKVHRAVAETFLDNPCNYPVINHKDGNKLNNNFNNLEWCTHQQNTEHAFSNGLMSNNTAKRKVVRLCDMLEFDSITEAGRFVNQSKADVACSNIRRALKNNGNAYGSKWAYI